MFWTCGRVAVFTSQPRRGKDQVVHHSTDSSGHVRHGVVHPLARLVHGDGGAGGRRQRLRRRCRRRLRAARGRAAPQRSGRRGADHHRAPGWPAAGAVRTGPGPGRRHDRALHRAGPGPGARHRSTGLGRALGVRHLDAAAARPRHQAAGRRAQVRHRLRRERCSRGRADRRHRGDGARAVRDRVDQLRRDLPARRESPGPRRPAAQPGVGRHLAAGHRRGRGRRCRPGGADRGRAPGVAGGLHRRGPGRGGGHPHHGQLGGAAHRHPHR